MAIPLTFKKVGFPATILVSYGRNPHYIYSDGKELVFDGTYSVPEELINAFLYKVLLRNRRNELQERLREGKKEWTYILKSKVSSKGIEYKIVSDPVKDLELAKQIEWINSEEDDIIKRLMGDEGGVVS